jgi:methionyl-tRNA formyltransferase
MSTVLFINGPLGIRILDYVSEIKNHRICQIFLNSEGKQSTNYPMEVRNLLQKKNLEVPIAQWSGDSAQIEDFCATAEGSMVGVSALFGHVLPKELISRISGGILNLHPSILPTGRGADPIPWNILENRVQGITIHLIDEGLDSGNVIFQREIPTSLGMSAGDVYTVAMNELFNGFSQIFEKWLKGECPSFPQTKIDATQHKSGDLFKVNIIQENEVATFGDFIRRLQATTFSDGRLPILKDNDNNLWEVRLKLINSEEREEIAGAK